MLDRLGSIKMFAHTKHLSVPFQDQQGFDDDDIDFSLSLSFSKNLSVFDAGNRYFYVFYVFRSIFLSLSLSMKFGYN